MADGQGAEDLLERLDVVRSVVGRERDTGEEDADVRGFECGEDLIEIAAGLVKGKAAEPVVTAELDDDGVRVQREDQGQLGDGVFCGCAARSAVEYFVMVAGRV